MQYTLIIPLDSRDYTLYIVRLNIIDLIHYTLEIRHIALYIT